MKKKLARSKNPAQGHAAARLAERRGMCHAELATRHPVVLAAQVVGILLAQKTGLASPSAEAFPKKNPFLVGEEVLLRRILSVLRNGETRESWRDPFSPTRLAVTVLGKGSLETTRSGVTLPKPAPHHLHLTSRALPSTAGRWPTWEERSCAMTQGTAPDGLMRPTAGPAASRASPAAFSCSSRRTSRR